LERGVDEEVFDVIDPWEVWFELELDEFDIFEFDWDPLLIGVDEFDDRFTLPVIFVSFFF
jgi:hypothetical protein